MQESLEAFIAASAWEIREGKLFRKYTLPSYRAAADFVQVLADLAEGQNHHPDILLGWKKVAVSLFTHDDNAIGVLDVEYAKSADSQFEKISS